MTDHLFDPGPAESKKKRVTPPSAGKIAGGPLPIHEVRVGTTSYYVRAYDEDNARMTWRYRYAATGHSYNDDELLVRRMYHADLVKLIELDPRMARRLNKL